MYIQFPKVLFTTQLGTTIWVFYKSGYSLKRSLLPVMGTKDLSRCVIAWCPMEIATNVLSYTSTMTYIRHGLPDRLTPDPTMEIAWFLQSLLVNPRKQFSAAPNMVRRSVSKILLLEDMIVRQP